jgi:hypothetical protein
MRSILTAATAAVERPKSGGTSRIGPALVHARLSTYDLSVDKLDEGIRGFREAIDRIQQLDGFQEALFLIDRENGQAVTITFWDRADSMLASGVSASRARSDAARAADGEVKSTCEYEVAIREPGSRPSDA